MKILDIAKNVNKKSPSKFDLKKTRVSLTSVLWAAFVVIFAAELYALYVYGYQNLVFSLPPETQNAGAAVRVNFVNYDKVVERLSDLKDYHATSTIDFTGKDARTGRDNPLTDPRP